MSKVRDTQVRDQKHIGQRSLTDLHPAELLVSCLKDFSLSGVVVAVLLPSLLGMVLVLPLGPDLTGPSLELGSTLTSFS